MKSESIVPMAHKTWFHWSAFPSRSQNQQNSHCQTHGKIRALLATASCRCHGRRNVWRVTHRWEWSRRGSRWCNHGRLGRRVRCWLGRCRRIVVFRRWSSHGGGDDVNIELHPRCTVARHPANEVSLAGGRKLDRSVAAGVGLHWSGYRACVVGCLCHLQHVMGWCIRENCGDEWNLVTETTKSNWISSYTQS